MSTRDAFLDAVRAEIGAAPDAVQVIPGRLVRFSTSGKRSDDSGWLRLFADEQGGVFGCWRRGIERTWQAAASHTLSALDRVQAREIERCRAERAAEDRKRNDEAAAVAVTCYRRAVPVARHTYLDRKDVLPPSGVRGLQQDGRSGRFWTPTRACGGGVERLRGFVLVIPMYDVDGRLRSLQAIDEAGRKSFLKGGRTVGLFFPIGARQIVDRAAYSGDVHIVEGLATGAAAHRLESAPTFVAFSSGNLKPVAQVVRTLYPRSTIIVAGDVDRSGAGQEAAKAAAASVDGLVALPEFTDDELAAGCTDWCDWAQAHRQDATVRRAG